MILATEVTEIAEHRVALLSALCALCGYFLINANALSIGRATTARLPTSTIGRWIRFGSATIAFITSRSGVSSVIPAAAVHGAGGGGGGTQPGGEQGSGIGYGLSGRPVGAYVIRGEEVSWRPAIDVNRAILGGFALAALLILRPRRACRNCRS